MSYMFEENCELGGFVREVRMTMRLRVLSIVLVALPMIAPAPASACPDQLLHANCGMTGGLGFICSIELSNYPSSSSTPGFCSGLAAGQVTAKVFGSVEVASFTPDLPPATNLTTTTLYYQFFCAAGVVTGGLMTGTFRITGQVAATGDIGLRPGVLLIPFTINITGSTFRSTQRTTVDQRARDTASRI
jgi:hypothetical protein